ncbi:MAG: Ig-like domain-containing protein [Cyanobacteria bacterium SID2]|nr:Ig-like domain-containing protein [Cyanobacteria bacterium SID2]MBP0004295.1 Ig-like domain-containing protein [Cyanobacteria bacterium SBC]
MPEIFFSEYIEGSSYNKALELYNPNSIAVDLNANNYSLELYANGASIPTQTLNLIGSIDPEGTIVLTNGKADSSLLAFADITHDFVINFNGNDTLLLKKNGSIVDSFGRIGEDPGNAWGSGNTATQDRTLRRTPGIFQGDSNANDIFDPALEWVGFPQNTFNGLGSHTATIPETPPSVISTTPVDSATKISIDSDLTVRFNEAVTVSGNWFSIVGDSSGVHTATASGSGAEYILDPDNSFHSGETVTITVFAANVSDIDTDDPPDSPTSDYSFSFQITTIGAVALNEICADPPDDTNGDGTPDSKQDEFVEIVNNTGTSIDLSGLTLSDALQIRHVFPPGTMVENGQAIVVFSGGTPTGSFGGSIVQTASTGELSLNNTGDTVTLEDGTTVIATYTYGNEADKNQSLTRFPDLAGGFVKHGTTGSLSCSPGMQTNGLPFPIDTTPPQIVSTTPSDNAENVAKNADLKIQFDESILKGTGSIEIHRSSDDAIVESIDLSSSQVTVSGSIVTVDLTTPFAFSTHYSVRIDSTAFQDSSGNQFSGIDNATTWNFTTQSPPDFTSPSLISVTPKDNAKDVISDTHLKLEFNEPVRANNGNLIIYNCETEKVLVTIDLASSSVTVDDRTVLIDLDRSLASATDYFIEIDNTAIVDLAGNPFSGISDTTTWNFSTIDRLSEHSLETELPKLDSISTPSTELKSSTAEERRGTFQSDNTDFISCPPRSIDRVSSQIVGSFRGDFLFGDNDTNEILGEDGDDTLVGWNEGDALKGGDGDDLIFGNRNVDVLEGGNGNDLVFAGQHGDVVIGEEGDDTIAGNLGSDCLFGDRGNDVIFGNTEVDRLSGGDGDDTLLGGRDNDELSGGDGDDVLSGDLGDDTLMGGAGVDRFLLGVGKTAILDFTDGIDRLVLLNGLTVSQLTVSQEETVTKIQLNDTVLAELYGVSSSSIDVTDFEF